MSFKTLIIYQNKFLFDLLDEISENINFKIIHIEKLDINFKDYSNYIIITEKKLFDVKNQLILDNLPLKISNLIEKINIAFLKQEYDFKSNIRIGKYELNLNSRILSLSKKKLDLTEMEANVILFLNKSDKPSSVKIAKNVWRHVQDLETHTVETHIYRLRKKIKDKFGDENFIKA